MISHGSVIMTGVKLGVNVIVNTLSSVDHDCVIGDHTQITAGVTLGGAVHTGKYCFFGIKSAVIPGIHIGDNTVVMAGSRVTKNATGNAVLGGYPAATLRTVK